MNNPILAFLNQSAEALQQRANDDIAHEGAQRLCQSLAKTQPKPFSANTLPVLNSVGEIDVTSLTQGFHEIAHLLRWKPSPRSDDGGTLMALSVINEMFELGEVNVGLLYLASGESYPEHQHPPQELYLTITGDADWRYGGSEHYVRRAPGSVLYNYPGDLHGIRANNEPLLAMYMLWSS